MIYKTLVENAPVAMIYLDKENRIVVWNKKATELFGYSSEEAVGKPADLIIPERFRAAHNAGYAKAINRSKSKFEGESPMKAKAVRSDGTKVIINVRMSMIRDENGNAIGMLAIAEKIPE